MTAVAQPDGGHDVVVFSDRPRLLSELLTAGRGLAAGGSVTAFVVGTRVDAEQAIATGADRVLLVSPPPDAPLDVVAPTLAQAIAEARPPLVLIGATVRGRAIAARLAVELDTAATVDVSSIGLDASGVVASRPVFGGRIEQTEKTVGATALLVVKPSTFTPAAADASRTGEIRECELVGHDDRLVRTGSRPKQAGTVDLTASRAIVCAGRGVADRADLAQLEELAALLGGDLACSRPLTEGDPPLLSADHSIGISGVTVRPDFYLGVGVSGQTQHIMGMSGAKVVAAINTNQSAPIFRYSDYGIVADLHQIVPALISALKS